ncbi:octanoyltransferase [Pilimelia terevasa]|uniref:Octanoyltransferase n=1 Tax=Pilimelia terevasa TaxID=53372 RepID=A0A8J3FIX0_9ACTN|nr:lipoyl(octanoyl) transferase LipB [Pilimelia terevasa]GGK26862.1 octanoyltransferase [Pilimelia terevasa]
MTSTTTGPAPTGPAPTGPATPDSPVPGLVVTRLGLVDYTEALAAQRALHARVADGEAPDTVLLLEHPSVYTAGKRTNSWDRPVDGTPVVDVDRGGRITWHGPGQIVGYPIITLPEVRRDRPADVVAHVRRVEQVLIDVCAEFGLATERVDGRSGVWVREDARGPDRKVAAIGIRVARGVGLHGFALNCDADLAAFDKIVPCGISDAGVTSLSRELGRQVTVAEALPVVERHLPTLLG